MNTDLAIAFTFLSLFAAGCASSASRDNVEVRDFRSTRIPAQTSSKHRYYSGNESNYKPDGFTLNYSVRYYCDRMVMPDSRRIKEHTLMIFENGKSAEFDTELAIAADGSSFSVVDPSGNVSGGGNFVGTPWSWAGMTAVFFRKNGMRTEDINIFSEHSITGFKKEFSEPSGAFSSGQLLDLDVAVLQEITAEDYQQALSNSRK